MKNCDNEESIETNFGYFEEFHESPLKQCQFRSRERLLLEKIEKFGKLEVNIKIKNEL